MEENSYRQILKSTTILGGTQFFNIIISVVRSKLVAVLLGKEGVGIIAMFNSILNVVSSILICGINTSGVREITVAKANDSNINSIIQSVKWWLLIVGILGSLGICFFSSFLSKWSFGTEEYSNYIKILSVALFFMVFSTKNTIILQSLRMFGKYAKVNISSAAVSLCFIIPIYYYLGVDGIVYSLIISNLILYLVSEFFVKGSIKENNVIQLKDCCIRLKKMLKFGVTLTVGSFLGNLVVYLVSIYISSVDGVEILGLYNAGMAIVLQYVSLVFNAMSTDYVTRLTAIQSNNSQVGRVVNLQLDIMLLIISPLLMILIVYLPIGVLILYSKEFLDIIPFMRWVILSVFFQAASWPIGYISFAKGDVKFFFIVECIYRNVFGLITKVIGYKYGGLEGIGLAILFDNFCYFLLISYSAYKRYFLKIDFSIIKKFIVFLLVLLFFLFSSIYIKSMVLYIAAFPFLALLSYKIIVSLKNKLSIS